MFLKKKVGRRGEGGPQEAFGQLYRPPWPPIGPPQTVSRGPKLGQGRNQAGCRTVLMGAAQARTLVCVGGFPPCPIPLAWSLASAYNSRPGSPSLPKALGRMRCPPPPPISELVSGGKQVIVHCPVGSLHALPGLCPSTTHLPCGS